MTIVNDSNSESMIEQYVGHTCSTLCPCGRNHNWDFIAQRALAMLINDYINRPQAPGTAQVPATLHRFEDGPVGHD